MLKHPNVIASCVLGASMIVAAIIVYASIHSLEDTIARRPIATPPGFPKQLLLNLHAADDRPLPIMIKQSTVPLTEPTVPLTVHVVTQK